MTTHTVYGADDAILWQIDSGLVINPHALLDKTIQEYRDGPHDDLARALEARRDEAEFARAVAARRRHTAGIDAL